MRRRAFIALALLTGAYSVGLAARETSLTSAPTASSIGIPLQGTLQPLFAPWDDIEAAIVAAIHAARHQILVQAYLLTSKPMAAALIAAHQRGIDVRVLVDAEQLRKVPSSVAQDLVATGIPVLLEQKYQNAHNKIMIIDAVVPEAIVITGSFNFTWTAQHRNAENVLISRNNQALAARYALNWERHWREALPFKQ